MYERDDDTVKLRPSWATAWLQTERALADARWWDAHEHLELIWRELGEGTARDSVQSMILVCAALHKPTQVAATALSRADAMSRLVARARERWTATEIAELDAWFQRACAAAEASADAWRTDATPGRLTGLALRVSPRRLGFWLRS